MSNLQRIFHDGQLVAVTVADHAIIAVKLPPEEHLHVQAMCLYALELAEIGRLDGYTDEDAEMYAEAARMYRRYGHLRRHAGSR